MNLYSQIMGYTVNGNSGDSCYVYYSRILDDLGCSQFVKVSQIIHISFCSCLVAGLPVDYNVNFYLLVTLISFHGVYFQYNSKYETT